MRELKFRIWSEEDKEYRSDIRVSDLVIDIDGAPSTIYNDEGDRFDIEQYTGLKDKNGKEIYEGDIVNIQGIKYYVDFEHGGFWFNNDNRKWKANRPFTHFQEINDAEVIGNVHENGDLLND